MALTTRVVNVSLRFPTPTASATVKFYPDLAAGDGQVLLEKVYTCSLSESPKTISTASNDEPIVITTATAHGYLTGEKVTVSGVTGNAAANGTWTITVIDSDEFELNGSVGTGSGTGGTVASTTIDGTIELPVFTDTTKGINYRVQFPRETGFNEHYINLSKGNPNISIDLSELLINAYASAQTFILDDLNDVAVSSPVNNQVLMYESATSLWKNKPITATSFSLGLTNGSVLFTNGSIIQQDNANFFWDDNNNRLGIRTNTPSNALHVVAASSFGQVRIAWDSTNHTRLLTSLAGVFNILPIAGETKVFGDLIVGSGTPPSAAAALHIIKTTEQARIGYDTSNYFNATVAANGGTTFDVVGGGAFTFNKGITASSITATTSLISNTYTEAVFGNAKLKLTDLSGNGFLTVKWDETAGDNTLNFKVNGGDRTINLSSDLIVDANGMVPQASQVALVVRNDEATTLTVGEVVYVSGASGEHVKVKRALATSDATSAGTIGMVIASITSGADGEIALHGVVTGVNTNAFNEGDDLWLSDSVAGGLTSTRPTAPSHGVFVGWVTKKSGNGKIALHIQNGYELEELHDVYITSPGANHFLVYDNTVGETRWENRSPADARTAMGLGTIATQDANNVSITGGTISGVSSIQATGTGTQLTLRYNVDNYATLAVTSAGQLNITTASDGFNPTPDVNIPAGLEVGGNINAGNVTVTDAAYGTLWNGSNQVPTKNAVYDKIETLASTIFTLPSLTSGSVLFSDGTTIAQDNANLFWDNSNNRLGVGTTTPQTALHVISTAAAGVARLGYDATNYVTFGVTSAGQLNIITAGDGINPTPDVNIPAGLEVGGNVNAANVNVIDAAYGSGWNGSAQVPTKNAVYDKIETLFTLPSLTSGSVLFSDGTTIAQDNANFFWDDSNDRLGIGNASPSEQITLARFGSNPTFGFRRANGTPASPSDVISGDEYGRILFTGRYTGAYYTAALITCDAEDAPSGVSGMAARLRFFTSNTGSPQARMTLFKNGNLGVTGNTSTNYDAKLQVLSTTEQLRVMYDASNYFKATVASDGEVTIQPTIAGTLAGSSIIFTAGDEVSITSNGAVLVSGDLTATRMFNTEIEPRVDTQASENPPAPDESTTDLYELTALAANVTFSSPGAGINGQKLMMRIRDNGTARTLGWNAVYVAAGATLPTTTVANKWMHLGFIYNTTINKWQLIAKAEEA
jgi:hypothetical protein